MPLPSERIADLVAALLSVNSYPLERAVGLVPALQSAKLLDPEHVASLPHEALIAALAAAGYDRGGYTPILAFRMYPLMDAISDGRLDGLEDAAREGDAAAFAGLLGSIHGFGPRTVDRAWMLWTAR